MPFGKYENFEECVSDNQNKESPEGFCAWLHYQILGEWPSQKIIEKGDEKNLEVNKDKNAVDSYETKMLNVRRAFESNNMGSDLAVINVFDTSVILKDYRTEKYYESDYTISPEGNVSKGELKEVELVYIQKKLFEVTLANSEKIRKEKIEADILANKDKGCELTGPIFKRDDKQRIVYAAVLVPGEPDYDYDKGEKILTTEEVERVAHKWMLEYMNIDVMHSLNNVAKPVETFLLPMEWNVEAYGQKMKLPIGTWVMASKVIDDETWKKVDSGELTGYSVMGIRNTALKSLLDSASKGKDIMEEIRVTLKKTLLKDLGEDWIVPFVSIVDEACVPKSKFFAIKTKEEPKEGIINRLVNFIKGQKDESEKTILDVADSLKDMVEKKGRAISDATYIQLKNAVVALNKLVEKADKERESKSDKNKQKGDDDKMDEQEVKKLKDEILTEVTAKIEEQLKPLTEAIKSLIPEKKEENVIDEADKNKKVEPEAKTVDKVDNKESVIKELQEKIEKYKEEKLGKTNSLKGQDGVVDNKPYTYKNQMDELDRDGFGRKKKKEPEKKKIK
jgi:hypothetical protein